MGILRSLFGPPPAGPKWEEEKIPFQPGDLVRLKSGGPEMTVEAYYTIEAAYALGRGIGAHCAWFDGEISRKDVFRGDALVLKDHPPT